MAISSLHDPLRSLEEGRWFKLICGASFQNLPAIRTLALVYSLAGADCIDVAADPAVIHAAREGITAAQKLQPVVQPVWLMVSLNDGEDPHFRKATFDPQRCPSDCSRPCVSICPAQAIAFSEHHSGVLEERCYGCGRCLPICPIEQITTRSHPATLEAVAPLIRSGQVNALELHTQVGHEEAFQQLWLRVQPLLSDLKILSISCPEASGILDYLTYLHQLIAPLPCPLIWQTDGRPMSGDIGDGATRATLRYGEAVLRSPLPGFVQLAGGTNAHTILKIKSRDQNAEHPTSTLSGIAFGSYARSLLQGLQSKLEAQPHSSYHLEDYPALLTEGLEAARQLVEPLKHIYSLNPGKGAA
ncbi:MAG: 4Fe-4S ferredoxin [Thermosynechococcaceae cyanobacterium MS004]|nr:4Fe-4S ferredoxin [Thermosynechococcaceae cyanobacterium MS004]